MKKKLLALLLATVMMLSLFPLTALAVHEDFGDPHFDNDCQIDEEGDVNFYDADGNAADEDSFVVSTSKTIAPTANENEFEITLQVKTIEDVENFEYSPNLAVVLLIDVSTSMQFPPSVNTAGKSATDRDTYYNSTNSNYVGGPGYFNNSPTGWNVYENYRTGKSRIAIAKTKAYDFLESYLGDQADLSEADRVARWISIATFGSTASVQQNWVNISTAAGMASAKAAINALYAPDMNYTFTQGGLQIAQNLLGREAINDIESKNQFVIVLTDGNPTYTKTLSPADKSVTTDSISGAGTGGTVSGSNVETATNVRPCRASAERVADAIKGDGDGAKIYTIGFALNDLTVDEKTGSGWLGESIATSNSHNYDADDDEKLELAFDSIVGKIINWAEAWTVTDPMGVGVVFDGFQTDYTNLQAEYKDADSAFVWDLKGLIPNGNPPTYPRADGAEVRVYELKYKVTLDTFTRTEQGAANDLTTLVYVVKIQEDDADPTISGELRAPFEIPEIHGYAADLEFIKVDDKGDPIQGVEFTLFYKEDEYLTETSDVNGLVSFADIPSGHDYTLQETAVPLDENDEPLYIIDETEYAITVSYGDLDITPAPDEDGSNFFHTTGADTLYFKNEPPPPVWQYGEFSILKTVDGLPIAEWLVDNGLDTSIYGGMSFQLYKVTNKGVDIAEGTDPIGYGTLDFGGYINFTDSIDDGSPLNLDSGWYAIVEKLEPPADEIFEQADTQYFYINRIETGNNISYDITGRSSAFDYESLYTIVNGYGAQNSFVLGYPDLNNTGDIFPIAVKNAEGKEYQSFCANGGSTNFAGDNDRGCEGYMVPLSFSTLERENGHPYSDFLAAFNYIYDHYGKLEDKDRLSTEYYALRAITQTVVWVLLGSIDDSSPAFQAIDSRVDKDFVMEVLDNLDYVSSNSAIVDLVYFVCPDHPTDFTKCQPQLVPVFDGEVSFDNTPIESMDPYGGASFKKEVIGTEDFAYSDFVFELFMRDENGEYTIKMPYNDNDTVDPTDDDFDFGPDMNGYVETFEDLAPGFYVFKEKTTAGWTTNFPDGLFFEIVDLEDGKGTTKTVWYIGIDENGDAITYEGEALDAQVATFDNIKLGSLTVTGSAKTTQEWEDLKEYYHTVWQPYKWVTPSYNSVTATNAGNQPAILAGLNPKNGNAVFDKKAPEDPAKSTPFVVPNSNHFVFAKFSRAELEEGVALDFMVGNKFDVVGTGFVRLNGNDELEITIDKLYSGSWGAIAFNKLPEINNGNIHSAKEKDLAAFGARTGFNHDGNLTIPCPTGNTIYLYMHCDPIQFVINTESEYDDYDELKFVEKVICDSEVLESGTNEAPLTVDIKVYYGSIDDANLVSAPYENLLPGEYKVVYTIPGYTFEYIDDVKIHPGDTKSSIMDPNPWVYELPKISSVTDSARCTEDPVILKPTKPLVK